MTVEMHPCVVHVVALDKIDELVDLLRFGPGVVDYRDADVVEAFAFYQFFFCHERFGLIFGHFSAVVVFFGEGLEGCAEEFTEEFLLF